MAEVDDDEEFVDASGSMFEDEQDTQGSMLGPSYSDSPRADFSALYPYGKTLTVTEALEQMRADVEQLREITCTSSTVALVLLKEFHFSVSNAKDRLFDVRDELFAKLKIDDESSQCQPSVVHNEQPVNCPSCWDECGPQQAASLARCRHWMCLSCLRDNLLFCIAQQGEVIAKRCPHEGCCSFAGEALFRTILAPFPGDLAKYDLALAREYLKTSALMRWCANPRGRCDHVIFVSNARAGAHEVRCVACSTRFCFHCGDDAHCPATCEMLAKWKLKSQDDSETANWIVANTKDCPKCKKSIFKDGGCNHMTCKQCSYEFCWVCEGQWSKHGSNFYQCNFYDPSANQDKERFRGAARDTLQRYIFYFTRYANHLQSQKLDTAVLAKVHRRMAELITAGQSTAASSRYLEQTAQVLFDCRHTLMYTYVYAFFLPESCEKRLFEYQQAQLEFATEELSEVIEGSRVMEPQVAIDKTAIAKKFHTEMAKGMWQQ